MKTQDKKQNDKPIRDLLRSFTSKGIKHIEPLERTASNRLYYRLILEDNGSYIASYNNDKRENTAFIQYAIALRESGVNVPQVYAVSEDGLWYIQDDLGNTSLRQHCLRLPKETKEKELLKLYSRLIDDLIHMQTQAVSKIDFSLAYPRAAFDEQSILWDLNYFKYYFLKPSGLHFDEQLLEDNFKNLIQLLTQVPSEYFLFRDFQSRNIMLHQNQFYYIDFQGGRKGPLAYDLASVLLDAKAGLSSEMRLWLIDYYFEQLPKEEQDKQKRFKETFWYFALIRQVQAMGAYGFRGLIEKKAYFIESIPLGLENLNFILKHLPENKDINYLVDCLKGLPKAPYLQIHLPNKTSHRLTVRINSFSYKKGLPKDPSDNGGGFVFDCRSIHNPGRYEAYKQLTGKDQAVKDFFLAEEDMTWFLASVYDLVDRSITTYIKRDFDKLMINFGCTGGQHRSVYAAEELKAHIEQKYAVNIIIHHIEQEKKNAI